MMEHWNDEIRRLRDETPGVANRLHFNNAGAALMPRPVIDAVREHLELEASIGGYEAAAAARREIHAFYGSVARLIGAKAHQIAYTTNATDSYNKALSSVPFRPGDVILTTVDDYVSNQIAFLQAARRFGVRVLRAENRTEGGVDLQSMAELMDRHRPRLVAVTHVPSTSGLVQPVAEVGALCRERGLLYLVDACQSAGQLHLDVDRLGCDFLSATMRKFLRGPRGAGFLYVSDRVLAGELAPLFLDLHSARWTGPDAYEPLGDARRFELWERPYALVLGSRAAADYAAGLGTDRIETRVRSLARNLRSRLQTVDGITVLDRGSDPCAIVTFHTDRLGGKKLKTELDRRGINTSLGSRDQALLDLGEKNVDWILRASPHYYNTEEEVENFAEAVREILRKQQ